MRRCYGCMKEYSEKYDVCPYCGYIVDTEPEVKSHLIPGTKLAGRFVVGKAIGHGGFGITYIAWDEKIRKVVAIKEYFPNAFSTRSAGETQVSCFNTKGEAFLREGVAKMLDEAKRLSVFSQNDNIVDISDYFEENNTAYIVMEYLEGRDLKKHLEENGGKLAPETSVEIILPVLNALEDMHKANLIHRDVSPDNIFICDNGKVKLLDFGSARLAVEDSDKSLSVMVKRGYAPKEQYASRAKQGPWTDVYSVCATLYRMITGQIPAESMEREDEPLISFSEYGITGYEALEKVIFKGLEVDYKDRIGSIQELREMLMNAENTGSVPVAEETEKTTEDEPEPEPTPEQPVIADKPKSKLNIKAIIAAVAAVVVIVAGVVAAVKFMPDKKPDTAETTTAITEEVELTLNASEVQKLYEEFLSSENLKKSHPTVHAFITKDISLLSQDKKEEFDTEMFGIDNLNSSVVNKEYHDFDNDGVDELLLSLDIDGEGMRMNVYLFDIGADGDVFEGASWTYVAPSRMYNHITVMQDESGELSFVEFTNDGNYWLAFVKSVYDGENLVPVYSLSIPDHQLSGYSEPDFGYCNVKGKSLYSPMGRTELEYPDESEIISVTYEKAYSEMDKLFGGTKIAGFCDDSWDDWKKIKISESGKINDSIIWKFYENGYLMIEGKGEIPYFDVNIYEEFLDRCPWKELRDEISIVGISKGITHTNDTFADSTNLNTVFLPKGLISIGDATFAGCYKLKNITIPDSVTNIGNAAFSGCSALTDITIPDGVTNIGDYAFSECSNITDILISNNVTNIGDFAFNKCGEITDITISNSVTNIGDYVFYGCGNLKDITIPDGVKSIGNSAFSFCYSLSDITIPEGVTNIGKNAFYGCKSIETIVIPKMVKSIGLFAFSGCIKLNNISVDSQNAFYSNDNYGALYSKDKTKLIKYPAQNTATSFVIPNGVTIILNYAFEGCSNLTNITIPDSVTNIDSWVFADCKNLTEITIPGSVSTISGEMFIGCENLESIILLDGVTVIGNNAFAGCKNLKNITIPSSVNSIEDGAFKDCGNLTYVYYSGNIWQWNSISIDEENQPLHKANKHYNS